jgi:lipopolysaccharide transport system ATP-binding protein
MKVIQFKDVSEKYRIKFICDGRVFWEEIWALKDVSFEVERGESIGIIGENGAGKTTLLKLIAGMLTPDRGEVKVSGRVSSLMELGVGFHPELTGKENIFLNATLYGLNKEEIEAKFSQIADFSGIGKFIDAPIKYYSQGMYMRLAFAWLSMLIQISF